MAISPNSQLPGFLIAGILVAIKSVMALTISYAWSLVGGLDTDVSVIIIRFVVADRAYVEVTKGSDRRRNSKSYSEPLFIQVMLE